MNFGQRVTLHAEHSYFAFSRFRSRFLIGAVVALCFCVSEGSSTFAANLIPLDPNVDKSTAVSCNEKYAGTPPALHILDPGSYIQPWSGFKPDVPATSRTANLPVMTWNLKYNDYQGMEVEGNRWSVLSCDLAMQSVRSGNDPFGSVMIQVDDETGEVIRYWQAVNRAAEWNDPTAHAEMLVIRAACRDLGISSLDSIGREISKLPQTGKTSHCELYTSHESCQMCYCACRHAKLPKLYFSCTVYDGIVQGLDYHGEKSYAELALPLRERAKFGMRTYQCSSPNSLDAMNLFKLLKAAREKP